MLYLRVCSHNSFFCWKSPLWNPRKKSEVIPSDFYHEFSQCSSGCYLHFGRVLAPYNGDPTVDSASTNWCVTYFFPHWCDSWPYPRCGFLPSGSLYIEWLSHSNYHVAKNCTARNWMWFTAISCSFTTSTGEEQVFFLCASPVLAAKPWQSVLYVVFRRTVRTKVQSLCAPAI